MFHQAFDKNLLFKKHSTLRDVCFNKELNYALKKQKREKYFNSLSHESSLTAWFILTLI